MISTTFSIVGTAGRQDDGKRLTENHFKAMLECAKVLLKQFKESDYGVDTLVSGGAAWADHCAVRLFLNKDVPNLKLFLPAPYLTEALMFDPTFAVRKKDGNSMYPGDIANSYHYKFSKTCGFNSLTEIHTAMERGAQIVVGQGFYARNALVAQSDIILAITFGNKEFLKDGGTAHTMNCYLNRVKKFGFFDKSFHYDLNSGDIFTGARVKAEQQ